MSLADKLRPHVDALMRDAKNGNHHAKEVITLYQMHRASPTDPAAPTLCECHFADWLAEGSSHD